METILTSVISRFDYQGTVCSVRPFGNGHINDTYFVKTVEHDSPDYILQRKNHHVFKNIEGMMENIIRVTNHIRRQLEAEHECDIERKVLTHVKTKNGNYYLKDPDGNYWVMMLFIRDSISCETIEEPNQAYMAGRAFGNFQQRLSGLSGPPLYETIPDFHNIEYRLKNFEHALKTNFENRAAGARKEIDYAIACSEEMQTLLKASRSGSIPTRITHNDTKINNILFDNQNRILCIIDLDTVMPGLVHYDFGDAIRTAANVAAEDETDISRISVNLPIFEAFAKGFLKELKDTISVNEIQLLAHSARFMAYIMGLRFLTDYLEGDVYYKVSKDKHNLVRAKAQFKLAEEFGKKRVEMERIICSLAG